MVRRWVACTEAGNEREIERALSSIGGYESVTYARSASDIRERLHDEEPHTVCAIVGLVQDEVSDVNLAAAIVSDGYADEVDLVVSEASGSLRSRASQAGISRVIALGEISPPVTGGLRDALRAERSSFTEWRGARERRDALPRQGCAPVVVFASGRGGVGKTSITAVTASLAARWGMRVALCDLDLTCGNLASSFGAVRQSDLAQLAEIPKPSAPEVSACGVACGERLSLWGPCARPEMAETVMPIVRTLLDELSTCHDLVMVDTSSTCTDAVAQAMQRADRLVLVHDVRPGGIASLARTSALAVRLGVARTRIVRMENRCAPRTWGQAFLPRAEVGLETARPFRALEGGEVVAELLAEGHVDQLVELEGDFVRSLSSFLAQVLKELGCLPESEEARAAEEGVRPRRRQLFFGRRKEAV